MGPSLYGFYYDTQAVFNATFGQGNAGNADWKEWRNTFEKVLIRHQQPEGYWEVANGHGMGNSLEGRILATCFCCLQLEVFYRYLPTFDIKKMDEHSVGAGGDIEEAGAGGDMVIEIE